MNVTPDVPQRSYRGIRSFVPWRGQTILKWSFPVLSITSEAFAIESGSNVWQVRYGDVQAIYFDPKALLIKKVDGTAGRFKASKRTVQKILRDLSMGGIPYTKATGSTYWMVSARPD